MLNESIYAIFERMWQHIISRFNNCVPISTFDNHLDNTDNPHCVTKDHLHLDRVDNTSDLEKPISDAVSYALGNKADLENFNIHITDMENPHGVTKEHLNLENVDNTSDLDKPVSYAVEMALEEKVDVEDFEQHIFNTDNPHNITAQQVGALPLTGGALESTLTVRGVVLTYGIDYGASDPGSGVIGQLYFKKVTT